MKISLAELRKFDPRSNGVRFACPSDECRSKPKDMGHRSLRVDPGSGKYLCHRCHTKGVVTELSDHKPRRPVTVAGIFAARPARRQVAESKPAYDPGTVIGRSVSRLISVADELRDLQDHPMAEEVLSAATLIQAVWDEN